MADLARKLQAHHAIVFGLNKGCKHTERLRAEWGSLIGPEAEIGFVPCDAGADFEALCHKVGLTMTPSWFYGGTAVRGYQTPQQIADLLQVPAGIADRLAGKKAVLYGRESCIWTARQKQVLGVHMPSVTYVNCDETTTSGSSGKSGAQQCAAAGVAAVPAWSIAGSAPIYGYRRMAELSALSHADTPALAAEAASSRDVLKSGRGAMC